MIFSRLFLALLLTSTYSLLQAQIPNELYELLDDKDTTNLYFGADIDPQFPGGKTELIKHYQKYLYYPYSARHQGIEGTIYMMFIVEKNGELTNIKPTNSINKKLDKVAIKLIQKMPIWIPGKKDGQIVRVLHIQPVTFKLE